MTNMPATMKMEYKIGINAPLVRREAKTLMVEGDRCANTIVIEVMDGLEPADLAGCSVSAIMKRSDGARPYAHGTVEGNVVTVCLNESFYAVPGSYELLVRLTHTDGTKRVILWLHGWINDEGQGDLIDTENVVPDLEDLLAQIDAMEQATQNATTAAQTATQAATDATSTANAAAASAQATAEAAAAQAVEIATAKGDEAVQVATDKGNEAVQIATEQVEVQNQAIAKIATDLLTKAPAIECEASGSLVTVTDAAAQPAVQLVTHIEPVQEGEGDPSPDNVRPFRGWDKVTAKRTRKNLFPYSDLNSERYGVTFTSGNDGTYTLNGTATADAFYRSTVVPFVLGVLPAGSYSIRIFPDNVGQKVRARVTNKSSNSTAVTTRREDGMATFVANGIDEYGAGFYVINGKTLENLTISIQMEKGETATAYEPYQGQTLTADLPETVYGGTLDWGAGVLKKYVFCDFVGTERWQLFVNASDATQKQWYIRDGVSAIDRSVRCNRYKTISIAERWRADNDLSVYFAVDGICFRDDRFATVDDWKAYVAELAAAGTPLQVCYEIATPEEIQLTPQQLSMLRGTNSLWSDTGDTDLVYVAATKLYIDQAIKAALNTTAEE